MYTSIDAHSLFSRAIERIDILRKLRVCDSEIVEFFLHAFPFSLTFFFLFTCYFFQFISNLVMHYILHRQFILRFVKLTEAILEVG